MSGIMKPDNLNPPDRAANMVQTLLIVLGRIGLPSGVLNTRSLVLRFGDD